MSILRHIVMMMKNRNGVTNINFSTFSEVDPNNALSASTSTATIAAMKSDSSSYQYYDWGANYWAGSIEVLGQFQITSGSVQNELCVIAPLGNAVGSYDQVNDVIGGRYFRSTTNMTWQLCEKSGGTQYTDAAYNISANTAYYYKLVIDRNVGTYGTAYLYLYSNSSRTTLLNTQSIALHSNVSYRYSYGAQSFNLSDSAPATSGTISNVSIAK